MSPSPSPSPGRRARGASPANRSLERGIALLRAFRPGLEILGNGELAERTGLSRATVSRLSQTLVRTGFLQYEPALRAYRLGAPVLSLAHAMRSGSPVLKVAAPWMRELAQARRINVGIAVADGDDMVYLESVRYSRKVSLRSVVAGQRVPIELTSLGRAYLAALPDAPRAAWIAAMKQRRPGHGQALADEIDAARAGVSASGYCVAAWQPAVVAVSTP
ncbi:MAG TPA: helix-turn-helix domain-containing protein, partial [Bordetella sp.]|nr:helix-turn-helix domain-containing protein [Bordetella sp.]